MATKDKLMKLLQEVRGLAEMRRPHNAQKSSPLFLVQLRSHMNETSRSRRRLVVSVAIEEALDFPTPIKIKHLKVDSAV